MKKILLLGGSAQQVVAIETAKKLGYYTVLCDYLTDNPGQYVADKFYLKSTTDKEAILEVAKIENVDGVVAYASDPAAPTAAYVAEKMNLPTNPFESVNILCNKDKFRDFLANNGFHTPMANGYDTKEKALIESSRYQFPVIIKPVDSSGSKGATVVYEIKDIEQAIDFAFSFSRSNRIVIEEFIEKKHEYLVGGDIFIVDGKVCLWGLMNCHRDSNVNTLVPVGKSYPLALDEQSVQMVKDTLQKLVHALNIRNGAMNVELIIDNSNRVFLIDVGPRSGGNMIPDLLGLIFNVDIVEMTIKVAMGKAVLCDVKDKEVYYATHNLHSSLNGKYENILFSEELEKYIIKKCFYKKSGDQVEYFDNAAKALGIIFMKFPKKSEMEFILRNISSMVEIQLK